MNRQNRWIRIFPWILPFFAVLLYLNSLSDQFVYDDRIVYTEHAQVQRGIAGIPNILQQDSYDGFYQSLGVVNHLEGGRYRPLSLVTFALEVEVFGNRPRISRAINIGFFALGMLAMWFFLSRRIFPDRLGWAAAICLLFAAHPIHVEAVANIKSRDEILSLGFILLSLFLLLGAPSRLRMVGAAVVFFFALLAKEYALLLFVSFPLIAFCLRQEPRRMIRGIVAMLPGTLAFFLLRARALADSPLAENLNRLDNPFLGASFVEALSTKLWALLRSFELLAVPIRLVYDYSFSQVPLKSSGDPLVILSVLVYVALAGFMVFAIKQRNRWGIGVVLFLSHLFMVSNFSVITGVLMADRLLYHASIGFCIMIVGVGVWACRWIPPAWMRGIFVCVLVLFCLRTLVRNDDWRSERNLFTRDVAMLNDSARANNNASVQWFNLSNEASDAGKAKQAWSKAVGYAERALEIHPEYTDASLNLGYFHFRNGNLAEAKTAWDVVRRFQPSHPKYSVFMGRLSSRYFNQGISKAFGDDLEGAEKSFRVALECKSDNALALHHLGGVMKRKGEDAEAEKLWTQAAKFWPGGRYKPWTSFGVRP